MPAGDVFGLDGFFLNKSNPVIVSAADINSTAVGAGITIVSGVLDSTAGIATLTLSTAAGLSTTPFYTGAKIAVSGLTSTTGVAFTGYNGNFVVTGFAGTTTVSYATTGYFGGVTAGITTTGLVMLVTDTAVTNTTWSTSQTHGYFGAGDGYPNPNVSTVDRVDFSNDTITANIRGPLTTARSYLTATGNSNYGWFTGSGPGVSLDRTDFSNDSLTASVRGPISAAKIVLAATSTATMNYGWFGGGQIGPGVIILSTVDRVDFSNDSGTALSRGPFSTIRRFLSAAGNSDYGWNIGGQTSQAPLINISSVDRINYANDGSTASVRGPLVAVRGLTATTGNLNYCWVSGGTGVVSTVERIDFSNDLVLPLSKGPLSGGRYSGSAAGNSNYGWFGGGCVPGPNIATVDRIDFSNDSVAASPRGPLSAGRGYLSATSGQARSSSVRLAKTGGYGWFGGGASAGGDTASVLSTVDRIDFSNDSVTASRRSLFSTFAVRDHGATGNSNYGWFAGGQGGPGNGSFSPISAVDRTDFSNDLVNALSKSPLNGPSFIYTQGTGNSNYGWFGNFSNTIQRIDFSNDSLSPSVRVPLSQSRYWLAATGNSNYGWFGGGYDSSILSTVDRIDFANDTAPVSVRGPLSIGRYLSQAATGNSNYGWFGGGAVPGSPAITASVDRIDFSNDSATASIRGPLTVAKYGMGATGNSNYGWFGGGWPLSTVDRIDFSNDSSTASPRGLLTIARASPGATSNTTVS